MPERRETAEKVKAKDRTEATFQVLTIALSPFQLKYSILFPNILAIKGGNSCEHAG